MIDFKTSIFCLTLMCIKIPTIHGMEQTNHQNFKTAALWKTFYQEPLRHTIPINKSDGFADIEESLHLEHFLSNSPIIEVLKKGFMYAPLTNGYLHGKHYEETYYIDAITGKCVDTKSKYFKKLLVYHRKTCKDNKKTYFFDPASKCILQLNSCNKLRIAVSNPLFDIEKIECFNESRNLCIAYKKIVSKDKSPGTALFLCTISPFTILNTLYSGKKRPQTIMSSSGSLIILKISDKIIKITATGATMPLDITQPRIKKLCDMHFRF